METFLYPEKEAIADEKVTQSHTPIKCRGKQKKDLTFANSIFSKGIPLNSLSCEVKKNGCKYYSTTLCTNLHKSTDLPNLEANILKLSHDVKC